MMARIGVLSFVVIIGVAAAAFPQQGPTQHASAPQPKQNKGAVHQDPGERAFQANCSRCHYAPEQLRPSITGTVLRHMRVRANLSADDEKAILRYLAP